MTTILTLIVAGAVLLFLETVLPGLIAGMVGMGCLIAAVLVAYEDYGPRVGSLTLLGVLAGLAMGAMLYLKYFPQSRFAALFISRRTVGNLGLRNQDLVRQRGVAATRLRPSGAATINGRRVDVVTEGPFVERETPVVVVAVEGQRVIVRAIEADAVATKA